MNILFLTIGRMRSIEDYGIYTDLLRFFRDKGHSVYTVSPYEKRTGLHTELIEENNVKMLHVSIGNITKCGIIEKGLSTLQIETKFLSAIKEYYRNIKFDLVLYSTPPITFAKVIRYIKKRDLAKTYLLLKDIFPQNAVDLGMMTTRGPKSLIYRYFRKKEHALYAVSDRIGCMSKANAEYILSHNPTIPSEKVEICPNCIDVRDFRLTDVERMAMRRKYGIPEDKKVFVYGGNLGKPQDVSFIVDCLKACEAISNAFFIIAGSGTDKHLMEQYVSSEMPSHVKLLGQVPKDEYDHMIACCDVGLIFLDHRFSIPNFPSRLLSYLQVGLPILACTDSNTDIGKIITEGNYGKWCESTDIDHFMDHISFFCETPTHSMGKTGYEYLTTHYHVERAYQTISAYCATAQDNVETIQH